MLKCLSSFFILISLFVFYSFAYSQPLGLGRPATYNEVSSWDIDIRPDGKGLPVGSGSVIIGEELYTDNCASCHGDFGEAVDAALIVGGQLTVVFRVEIDDGIAASTAGFDGYVLALFKGEKHIVFIADGQRVLLWFPKDVSGCLGVGVVRFVGVGLWATAAAGATNIGFVGAIVTLGQSVAISRKWNALLAISTGKLSFVTFHWTFIGWIRRVTGFCWVGGICRVIQEAVGITVAGFVAEFIGIASTCVRVIRCSVKQSKVTKARS